MGVRVCIEPGCWQPTHNTRCAEHERAHQQARNARRGPQRTVHAPYRKTSLDGLVCACCGTRDDLTRHHVLPLAGGARPVLPAWAQGFDLVAMCRPCNSSIGERVMATRECPKHGGTIGAL